MKLKDQTILITGGGSGIGLGLAEAFQQLGNRVIVAGRSKSKLETAKSKGLEVLTVDMADGVSIQKFAAEATRLYPTLNYVIHNAGMMVNEKLSTGNNAKKATDTVLTNLLGPMLLTNALLPHLLKQPSATIMTVTSGLAYLPLAMTPSYCATKAAIHSYTESLRYQLKDTAVAVKELVPPYVRTSLMGDRQANDQNAMPLQAFIDEVMEILKNKPETDEVIVKNAELFRSASFQGAEHYQDLFQKRNDFFMNARKKEWDELN
jgi:uncharacterized oxidoreductase